jgi:hypothetical protein
MAIWQWRLNLIPEIELLRKYEVLPLIIPMESAEDGLWWTDAQPAVRVETLIDEIFPAAESWSPSMRMWGDEDGNHAYVSYLDTRRETVEQIGFRLDARSISRRLLSQICTLARRIGCVLLTSEYEVLAPDESMLFDAMIHSRARRFVENPESTLQELDKEVLRKRTDYLAKSSDTNDSSDE